MATAARKLAAPSAATPRYELGGPAKQCETLHGLAVQSGVRAREPLGVQRWGAELRRQDILAAETMAQSMIDEATSVVDDPPFSGVRTARVRERS